MSITPAPAAESVQDDVWPDGPTWLRADALCLAGFASLCAGAIHAAAIGAHSDHDQAVLVFAIVAGFQLVWGALAVARSSRALAVIGAVGNLALVGGWAMAKRSGIGFVDGLEAREPIEVGDGLAAGMASLAVVLCLYTVLRPHARALLTQRIAVTGACVAVALLALPGMSAAARPGHPRPMPVHPQSTTTHRAPPAAAPLQRPPRRSRRFPMTRRSRSTSEASRG